MLKKIKGTNIYIQKMSLRDDQHGVILKDKENPIFRVTTQMGKRRILRIERPAIFMETKQ